MVKLSSRTRDNLAAQGKQKVYFCCHPDDFDQYFDTVCEDIFKYVDCTIWYKEDPSEKWDPEEMQEEAGFMQLFVIPVTRKFLEEENEARCVELPFAVEHHIPVLPLLQEKGLETEFHTACGPILCLDRLAENEDMNAVPYDQKFGRFFAEVMLDDVWEKKVGDEFSTKIYLSYRKQDRNYAQDLIREIHQNEDCRDLAILHEDFLSPEEDFDDAARAAMEESSLIVFVITPNVLEPENPILTKAYPAARESGKPILFVEMVPTDGDRLKEAFAGMPEVVNGQDEGSVSEAMEKLCQEAGIQAADQDPEHLFMIGLGYLSGVCGDADPEKGVEIFTKAADQGNVHAQYILGVCYSYGQGAPRDDAKAVQYYTMAADQGYSSAQYNLAACLEEGRGADKNPRKAAKLYKQVAEKGNRYAETALGRCYFDGTGFLRSYSKAAMWFSEAADQEDPAAQFDLGLCYMGGHGVAEDLEEAASWFEKAAEQGFAPAQYNIGICYQFGQGVSEDYAKAVKWLAKAARQGHPAAQYYLGRDYDNGKGVARDVRQAYDWYKKAAEQGEPHAQAELGLYYINGKLDSQEDEKVAGWDKKLARWDEELAHPVSEDEDDYEDEEDEPYLEEAGEDEPDSGEDEPDSDEDKEEDPTGSKPEEQ